jgi:two-component system chemotaxis response regulator CheY
MEKHENKKILVIDDSRSLRQMVAYTLNTLGYEVVEAVDGKDGWQKSQAEPFDLVFTDQNMPQFDGIWLIKALRNSQNYRNIPIFMLTNETGEEMKALGKEAGATGWIVKPFDPKRLLELVHKAIGDANG